LAAVLAFDAASGQKGYDRKKKARNDGGQA
jgi:hypothetical protein